MLLAWLLLAFAMGLLGLVVNASADEMRFPAPTFSSGYKLPETTVPEPTSQAKQWIDVVVLVAAFLTMSLLLVLVLKKTREIGLLGALGASRRQIALCFCLQGIGVGVVGTAAGLGLGLTVLHFRNDIVRAITRVTGGQELMARFYQFSELPEHIEVRDLVVIVTAALVLSTLAGIIPAVIAARLKPVEALRSE